MAQRELYIRTKGTGDAWRDAYDAWGVSFTDTALSALMTPPPVKSPVENKSRIQDGKQVITDIVYTKKDERDVTLEMHIKARNRTEFWSRYESFCEQVLGSQFIDIRSGYIPGKVFHMTYESCSQFSEFMQELAKFTLRLNEPNPGNRT